MNSNRISKYLDPDELVPSQPQSFDDFMIRGLADVLTRMMKSGIGTKSELIKEYSEGKFSIGAPLYCAELQVDNTTVTPRQVFQVDSDRIDDFSYSVEHTVFSQVEDAEAADLMREQWYRVIRAFRIAPYFIVWRMAFLGDTRDDEDSVGLYGAYCNMAAGTNHWDAEVSGILLAAHFRVLLRANMIQPVGRLA